MLCLLLYYFTEVSALVQFRIDKFLIGRGGGRGGHNSTGKHRHYIGYRCQTYKTRRTTCQRNCVELESDLTLTVSTAPPRITSINLLLKVTQVKSASLLLHVTEGTSVCLLSHVTQVTSVNLLLNVARSEVSCYTVPRSQVYVSCLTLLRPRG